MSRRDEHLRGYPMDPQWEEDQPLDPNWSAGRYYGMRMRPGQRQAAYGLHRLSRQRDLLGYGGFHGVYDEGAGRFDAAGAFRHPRIEGNRHRRLRLVGGGTPDDASRHVEDGGVRADNRYLGQYNAASPMLRDGHEGELGYGHAPAGGRDGELAQPGSRGRTDERGYAGYNQSGFAPDGSASPLDPRR